MLLGPGATEQDIQKFRDTTKDMSIQLLHLFWLLVKFDINNTIGSELHLYSSEVVDAILQCYRCL